MDNEKTDNRMDELPKDWKLCLNPGHNFPTHLYIPPGQSYTHVCPGCGAKITVTQPIITA